MKNKKIQTKQILFFLIYKSQNVVQFHNDPYVFRTKTKNKITFITIHINTYNKYLYFVYIKRCVYKDDKV